MSRAKVVVEEGVVRVVTVGIQGPPGVGISQAYVGDGDAASRQRSNHTGTQPSSTISDFNTAADARIEVQKGISNGVATLGSDAKIPTSQLPALAITDTFVMASQAAMLALTAEVGGCCRTNGSEQKLHSEDRWRLNARELAGAADANRCGNQRQWPDRRGNPDGFGLGRTSRSQ
jgi:hypothetical protein